MEVYTHAGEAATQHPACDLDAHRTALVAQRDGGDIIEHGAGDDGLQARGHVVHGAEQPAAKVHDVRAVFEDRAACRMGSVSLPGQGPAGDRMELRIALVHLEQPWRAEYPCLEVG